MIFFEGNILKNHTKMDFECSICLDNLFSVNTDVSVTQCGHVYHKSCLESATQINKRCPICNAENINVVKTIFPNVYKELNYSCCSNDTKEFIKEILDNEREKREIFLNMVKKLDKEKADNLAKKEKFLKTMANEAERMSRLVNELLSLSRIERTEFSPPEDKVDLNKVLKEVEKICIDRKLFKKIKCKFSYLKHTELNC